MSTTASTSLSKLTISDTTTATYTYNGDGLRTSKTVNGTVTNHIWDGDQIALETDSAGNVINKYVRGINLLYAENTAGTKQYYLFNGHGDVVQLTGTDGNVTKNYDYDAFGNEKNPDANDSNVFRYCGEYFDLSSGTYYLRARYYDPQVGRFISEDSNWGKESDPLSLNLYTYCGNNPINAWDPTGHYTAYEMLQKLQGYGSTYNSVSYAYDHGYMDEATYNKTIAELHCKADYIRSCILASTELKSTSSCRNDELTKLVNKYFFQSDGKTFRTSGQTSSEMDALLKAASDTTKNDELYFFVEQMNYWNGLDNTTVDYNADIAICFKGDTLVYTKDGDRPIKDIKIGDEVYSENPQTGEKGLKKVRNVFVHETNTILHVIVDNEDINTTETHPFWVVGNGWTPAGKLKSGDRLLLYSGKEITVNNIKKEVLQKPIKVYNFEVEDWHTYFVSNSYILVHNTCSLFVPNNSKWIAAGTDMWAWKAQNGFRFTMGGGTDIGKIFVQNGAGEYIGEIHNGQIVKYGSNAGKIYQPHYQEYINGATNGNEHLYFED